MLYEEFLQKVMEDLIAEDDNLEIEIRTAEKMQGASYTGLTVCEKGEKVGVSVNLKDAYERFQTGSAEYDWILHEIINRVESAIFGMPDFGEEIFRLDPEHIVYQAVNEVWSRDLLVHVPHRRIGSSDLALIARIVLEMPDEDGGTVNGSVVVDDGILEKNGVTEGELFGTLLQKVAELRPASLIAIEDLLSSLVGSVPEEDKVPLYVATVGRGEYGSGVLGYPGFLQRVHDQLGDVYCLPSSVHEVLLLPTEMSGITTDELVRIVMDVNATQVEEKDRLSDNVYFFDGHDLVNCRKSGSCCNSSR